MKLLHTSDWHVGKTVRGHSRAAEHQAVLAEMVQLANTHEVDLVLVAGDLFDSAAPTAESEQIVYQGLLDLAAVAPVVAVAGNHDNARRLSAVARLLELGRVTVATEPRSPSGGGVLEVTTEGGERARIALVPFVSQRAIVRSDALMSEPAFRNAQTYADRLQKVVGALTGTFASDSVNIVLGHLFVTGAAAGGGERPAHLIDEYGVSGTAFSAGCSYVALGHLHRAQSMPGATAIHYCGSPLQLDFGEQGNAPSVNLVEAEAGLPARVDRVALTEGRSMVTLSGRLDELAALAAEDTKRWLRIEVDEDPRPGLAEEVREMFGDSAVEVRIVPRSRPTMTAKRQRLSEGRSPSQLFGDYLDENQTSDPRLHRLFDELHDEVYEQQRSVVS